MIVNMILMITNTLSGYYAVPGYRRLEYKILIPIDCGFEEAIKDDMDFVYYKAAEKR